MFRRTLKKLADGARERVGGEPGFVLPVVIFGLMLMTTVAVVAMSMGGDEQRSSRAMRESSVAFYVAEAGIQQVWAEWDSIKDQVEALTAGDSLVLSERALGAASSYQGVVQRVDAGGQPMYAVRIQGKGPGGALAPMKTLSLVLTTETAGGGGGEGEAYRLGECCDAAATVRGSANVEDDQTVLDGHDTHPPGWETAGACSENLYDKPGLLMQDTTQLTLDEATLDGIPPLIEDASINDATFSQFGDLSWDEIKDMADHTMGQHGESVELVNQIRPSYNGDGSCNTSDPYNWGSNDPSDPCFNYFPIILVRGDFSIEASYGQATFILDYYIDGGGTQVGAEFDLDDDSDLNGLILGRGCVELKDRGQFHGGIFVDGDWTNPLCAQGSSDMTLDLKRDGKAYYSQCAVDRAIKNSLLKDYAEATVEGSGAAGVTGTRPLDSRAFMELIS
jgi:hypothetical protein